MVGEIEATHESDGCGLVTVKFERENGRGTTRRVSEHQHGEFCAGLIINGQTMPYPQKGCWCPVLLTAPPDEVIFSLGKSVLDGLTECPLKGQDGSRIVVVELQI